MDEYFCCFRKSCLIKIIVGSYKISQFSVKITQNHQPNHVVERLAKKLVANQTKPQSFCQKLVCAMAAIQIVRTYQIFRGSLWRDVYYLQYLEIFPVIQLYMTTYHGFELRFTAWTTVRRIDPVPDAFLLHTYRLRSLNDIAATITDKTSLAGGFISQVNSCTSMSFTL